LVHVFGLSFARALGTASGLAVSVLVTVGAQAVADTGASDVAKLNSKRSSHGIPARIVHVPEWTRWCDLHISYMQANGGELTHGEQPGQPGYTTEGQKAGATSVLSKGESWDEANPWESAPIHLNQLLAPRLDAMGIADRDSYVCATTLLSRNRQAPAANIVYTYPGNGTRHRFEDTATEFPYTPGELVGIPAGTRTGPYLYVMPDGPALNPFSRARIVAASLTGPSGKVALGLVDNFTPGLAGFIPTGGQLIPTRPLQPATTYTARVAMFVQPAQGAAAIPFAHQWSFSTVSGPPRRPGLRLVGTSSRGRVVNVALRVSRGARGRVGLRIRRCVRTRGRTGCNGRQRLRVKHTRRGTLHRFKVQFTRPGRWALRPQFDGSRGWGDQRLQPLLARLP